MYKQKNNILFTFTQYNINNYGFQLLYFSSINMDGAAEKWSTEGGPARRQTQSPQSRNSVTHVVHTFILTASCFYLDILTIMFLIYSPHIQQSLY